MAAGIATRERRKHPARRLSGPHAPPLPCALAHGRQDHQRPCGPLLEQRAALVEVLRAVPSGRSVPEARGT
jgi:hypothetical protein